MEQIYAESQILNSAEGQKLGKSPLDFLSKELSNFESAMELFASRKYLPRTEVGKDFHRLCDNVPNVLVIIKSGQYIAGGYTEVPFNSSPHYEETPKKKLFLYSLNRQTIYQLKHQGPSGRITRCGKAGTSGPTFGQCGLFVANEYSEKSSYSNSYMNYDSLGEYFCSFDGQGAVKGELFGIQYFQIDAYEVWELK